jgi:hypothetical protein
MKDKELEDIAPSHRRRSVVLRFNAEGPSGLATGKVPGHKPFLGERERAAVDRSSH